MVSLPHPIVKEFLLDPRWTQEEGQTKKTISLFSVLREVSEEAQALSIEIVEFDKKIANLQISEHLRMYVLRSGKKDRDREGEREREKKIFSYV